MLPAALLPEICLRRLAATNVGNAGWPAALHRFIALPVLAWPAFGCLHGGSVAFLCSGLFGD